jgi:hypothetical protein
VALVLRLLLRRYNKIEPPPEIVQLAASANWPVKPSDIAYIQMVTQAEMLLDEMGNRHYGDSLAAAILAYGQVYQKSNASTKYWVEKTPHHEQFAKEIFGWWPEARCIHVVRDPRDNYTSYSKKRSQLGLYQFAETWQSSARVGLSNQKKYGNDRYLIVKYEDLLTAPEENLAEIAAFLGIENHISLRNPTRGGVMWSGNSMFSDTFDSMSTAPIGRYQEGLNHNEVHRLETFLWDEMNQFDYPSETSNSVFTRWVGKWHLYVDRFRRGRRVWKQTISERIRTWNSGISG